LKIFLSHSSTQKALVREIKRHLPSKLDAWLDEVDLAAGTNVANGLQDAIARSDMLLLLIDHAANKSEWVAKEIQWAIEKEDSTGLPFLLPVMCDPEAWADADPRVRERKFLQLHNQEEESIAKLGRELTSEVLGWMSLRLDRDNAISPGVLEAQSNAELIRTADQLFEDTATQIKSHLLPYRSENPIALSDFADLLRRAGMSLGNVPELTEMLDRLRAMHRLNGVEYDDEYVFLSRESYSFKADLHTELKRRIARRASREVESGMTVGLDGGSTVLQVAQQLVVRLRANTLNDLTVVTNSLPIAMLLTNELSTIGAGDRDRNARVLLFGGLARPVSLTTIPFDFAKQPAPTEPEVEELDRVREVVGALDIAFLGANGMYGTTGLGTKNKFETAVKSWMVSVAERRLVLMDPTKLDIPQHVPFATFDQGLRIITGNLPGREDAIATFAGLLEGTPSSFEVVS